MKVLITGGAGFIGSNIAKYHINKNDTVRILDDLSTGDLQNLSNLPSHAHLQFVNDSMSDISNLQEFTSDVDVIYHFAAKVGVFNVCKNPIATLYGNVTSTYNLFEALRKNKTSNKKTPRIFIASTSEVYGKDCHVVSEDSALIVPCTKYVTISYAVSKIANENMAFCYYSLHNLPITVLRIFNMIGQGQTGLYGMVVPRFIQQALSNEDITVYGDGKQRRSFCDIRDFLHMLARLLDTEQSIGQTYNIGHGQDISIDELAHKIKALLNSQSSIIYIPYRQAYETDYIDTIRRTPNINKLQSLINYDFAFTLDQSILDIANTFISK